ncbi:MAG TPA: histidine phosphatase family protein [Solirubrobacteraceae bacterium]|nr:histidine phosphatase family protein [Solirubrobacteraceae bacterium]
MAGTLWLLRHGDAEPHGARADFERRLTVRGERQARAAGCAFARLGISFDDVFASPRVRALDTARLACAELGLEPTVHEPLSGGFDEHDCARLLAGSGSGASVLLVGHEPDLSGLVASMTGARVEMKKGGIAAIRDHQLVELLRPNEIELVAGL